MRFLSALFLFLICFACFFSCASAAKENRLFTNITDSSKFFLLPSENMRQTMDMAQYVSAEFGSQNYFFTSWVKADENALEMAFFNELGASLGELSYMNSAVHFSSNVIPKAAMRYIKPEYIVADFQLCFYDPVMLGRALEGSGLVLEIQDGNRRILNGEEVIIEIIKTEKTVTLKNNLRGYAYTMEGDFLDIENQNLTTEFTEFHGGIR